MSYRSVRLLFLFFSACFMLLKSNAHAQEETISPPPVIVEPTPIPTPTSGLQLVVSPPIIDLRTEPNQKVSTSFKIKNNGDGTEYLKLDLMKFVPDRTGAKPQLSSLSPNDIFPQWLNFSESQFTMESKSWKTINMTFNPPDNASPAYYFAVVVNRQNVPQQEGQTALDGAAAILVLVQVSSSRVYHQLDLQQLTSQGFDFKTKKIYEFLPVNFSVTLNNSGNVHEQAYGNIFIDWVSGNKQDVGIVDVNQEQSFILPQTTRTFNSAWTDGFPVWVDKVDSDGNVMKDKKGNPQRKLQWDFSKITSFRIGKYNATLLMIYNDGVRDIPLEAQTSFWVIPWRLILAALVIILLLLFGFKGIIQNIWQKIKNARHSFKYRNVQKPNSTDNSRPHI